MYRIRQKMTKIENHLRKIKGLENSRKKLDSYEEDYEAIVELYMLICAHYINAALHKSGKLEESKDIKHNLITSFLIDQFGGVNEVKDAIQKLENLRPSHIYGKGENGETAKKAEEQYNIIKKICGKIIELGESNER